MGVSGKLSASVYLIVLILSIVGCGTTRMNSTRPAQPVSVDGMESEWEGALVPIKDKNFTLGLSNDDEYLYVSMVTGNRPLQMQMLTRGLTVWFDRSGSKGKSLGIHFPLGVGGEFGGWRQPPGSRGFTPDMEGLWARIEPGLTAFELIRNGDHNKQRLLRAQSEDIKLAMSYRDETLVYEIRVPLRQNEKHPIGIGLGDGKAVGLGLETPKFERAAPVDREDSGAAGGIGGAGSRGGFGDGGRRRGGGLEARRLRPGSTPERLEYWTSVNLDLAH